MGTRNLTMAFVGGEYKLAQYGQWDGYPEGQGIKALEFARDEMDRDRFLANLSKCREVDSDEIKRRYKSVGADGSGWVNMEVSDRFRDKWPELDRDMGAKILSRIQNADEGLGISTDLNFAGDSLFCEWAYLLDFDANTFEAYQGFNKTPLSQGDRFVDLPRSDNPQYYQIRLAHSWPLDGLPSNDGFLAAFKEKAEEAVNG